MSEEITVHEQYSGGATAANDEAEMEDYLINLMKGNGGRRGLSVSYQASQDGDGNYSNLGTVRIIAKNSAAAARFKKAQKARKNQEELDRMY